MNIEVLQYFRYFYLIAFFLLRKIDKIKSFDDMEPLPLIFDFTEDDIHEKWIVVNDNVMGGRSKGGFEFKNEKLIFSGQYEHQWGWVFFHSNHPH